MANLVYVPLEPKDIESIINDIPNPPGIGKSAVEAARNVLVALVRRKLKEERLLNDPRAFQMYKDLLLKYIYTSFIEGGENVGTSSATSLAAPMTQMSLKTFHFIGTQSGTAISFQKIRSHLTGSKQNKDPQMNVYFKTSDPVTDLHDVVHYGTYDFIISMRSQFEQTTVKDLVVSSEIVQGSSISDLQYLVSIHSAIFQRKFINASTRFPLKYVLVLHLNTYRMYTHNITMGMMARGIEGPETEVGVDALVCVWRSQFEGIMYVIVDESRSYNKEAKEAIEAVDAIVHFLHLYVKGQFPKWLVSGIANITAIEPIRIDILDGISEVVKQSEGTFRVYTTHYHTRWVGISLYDIAQLCSIMGMDLVEINRTELYIVVTARLEYDQVVQMFLDSKISSVKETVKKSAEEQLFLDIFDGAVMGRDTNGVSVISVNKSANVTMNDILRIRSIIDFEVTGISSDGSVIAINFTAKNFMRVLRELVSVARIKFDNKQPITEFETVLYNTSQYYYMLTIGSNMDEIIWRDDVDLYRCTSNFSHEVQKLRGIDATKFYLTMRFQQTLDSVGPYVNKAHTALVFDLNTNLGTINSLSFAGLNRRRIPPLSLASHEQAHKVFGNSAIFGETEYILGVSEAMYTGGFSKNSGTGSIQIKENFESKANREKYGKEPVITAPVIEGVDTINPDNLIEDSEASETYFTAEEKMTENLVKNLSEASLEMVKKLRERIVPTKIGISVSKVMTQEPRAVVSAIKEQPALVNIHTLPPEKIKGIYLKYNTKGELVRPPTTAPPKQVVQHDIPKYIVETGIPIPPRIGTTVTQLPVLPAEIKLITAPSVQRINPAVFRRVLTGTTRPPTTQ